MKRTTTLLLAVIISIVCISNSFAASASLEITYATGLDDITPEYTLKLWVEKVPGSDIKVLLGDTNVDTEAPWLLDVTDVPNGRNLNYYLSVIDPDSGEVFSPPYPFKLTGNPKILKMVKKR